MFEQGTNEWDSVMERLIFTGAWNGGNSMKSTLARSGFFSKTSNMDASRPMSLNDDIVRLIFERVRLLHYPSALNMLSLSKSVRRCLEPALYGSVVLDEYWRLVNFATTMAARVDLGRHHVKRLVIGKTGFFGPRSFGGAAPPIKEAWVCCQIILAVCSNVRRLAFWIEECNGNLAAVFNDHRFPYPHLTDFSLENIVQYAPRSIPACACILPMSLTHLHLEFFMDMQIPNLDWAEVFERCTGLTHVLITSQTFAESIAEGDARLIPRLLNPVINILPTTMVFFVVCINPLPSSSPAVIRRCISQLSNQDKRVLVISMRNDFLGRCDGLSCFAENREFASEWRNGRIWEFAEKCVAERDES